MTHLAPTVLVVDDEPDLREVLELALADAYQVSTAASGEQALAYAEHATIDVIVLDVTMPGITGLEVCRALRERGDHTPVLMLSGRATRADHAAGLDAGADDYITKPYDLHELLARIRALLGTRRPGPDVHYSTRTRSVAHPPDLQQKLRRASEGGDGADQTPHSQH
jgi:two-component system response regulator MprA